MYLWLSLPAIDLTICTGKRRNRSNVMNFSALLKLFFYRMLRSLLSAGGVNPSMVTVYIDGFFEEPMQVVRLFGLKGVQHTPLGVKNARITQHYKASLTATFKEHPIARYAILVEEDLDVSPDFFQYVAILIWLRAENENSYQKDEARNYHKSSRSDIILQAEISMQMMPKILQIAFHFYVLCFFFISYFSQLKHLLDEDPTLYCISAWNGTQNQVLSHSLTVKL